MSGEVDITAIASLLADATRTTILLALSDGRAFTASELARYAKVAPSTASEHLARLVDASLLTVEKQGRHRFYRLANPDIVEIMEQLARLAPQIKIRSLHESEHAKAVHRARMCYHHLAGRLGVLLTEAFIEQHILRDVENGFLVEDEGAERLEQFGLIWSPMQKQGERFVLRHIDWSERKYHVAGSFGAALAQRLLDLHWIERHARSRAVHLTADGYAGLEKTFHVCL